MRTLIILAHPDINNSKVNKAWKNELLKHKTDTKIHELYLAYPDWQIDVEFEQEQLEEYENIVIQFPFYWYSYPPLLKKWFDEVFLHGWAYGSNGCKMMGKKIVLAISIGDKEYNYDPNAPIGFSLETLLSPFKATLNHIKADFMGYHTIYGSSYEATDEEIVENALIYVEYLYRIFEIPK